MTPEERQAVRERDRNMHWDEHDRPHNGPLSQAEIDRAALLADVERLEGENDGLRKHIGQRAAGVDPLTNQLRERAEAAERERDALREGLRKMIAAHAEVCPAKEQCATLLEARALLTPSPERME